MNALEGIRWVKEPDRIARQLADRYWDDLLELDPLIGTETGDERFDDRLPDPSPSGLARRQQVHTGALDELRPLNRDGMDLVARTTLEVMEAIAKRSLVALEHRFDRFEAVMHLWGPSQLLATLGSLQRADTPERLQRYLGRLPAVPAYLDATADVMDEAQGERQTVPKVIVERTIAQMERLLQASPESSPAMKPVEAGSDGDRLLVLKALREVVLPAYGGYLSALRRYAPFATDTIGRRDLPAGDAIYAAEMLSWTGLPLDAQSVHELGQREWGRIQEERLESAQRLGFADPSAAIAAHQESGRNTASSRSELLELARDQVARGWDAAPAFFGTLPRGNCDVRSVEEYREADMPFAFYQPPTADNSRPGVYYVNTHDLPQRPLHHLATTTYHEANPGHHFQISLEQELPERPALRRFGGILAGSAFIEGWGLYSERLADEMGLFRDEWERLGMLDAQGMRACRLIVDTGLHALGWDRERAVTQMKEAGVPQLDAEVEVDRYIAIPAQALCYKIGQIEIEKWRARAAEREGASFSLKDFHDRLLRLGSLPLAAVDGELTRDLSA